MPLPYWERWPRTHCGFEALTGGPWDEWAVVTDDRRFSEGGEPNEDDAWALVWMNRLGAASGEVARHVEAEAERRLEVRVRLGPGFDPARDYLIVEHRQRQPASRGPVAFPLELLAGTMPRWAIFPWAWARWVFDRDVVRSAHEHIARVVPSVAEDVEYAAKQGAKANRARAWRIVGEKVGRALGRDLGRLDAHSWTAAAAMPLRIASRIGGWVHPIPKPEFEDPKQSGRILLASSHRIYPTGGS